MSGELLFASMAVFFFYIFLAFCIRMVIEGLCNLKFRKTTYYRKDLTNLYVAGKVRQLAAKDGIDLDAEKVLFDKYVKRSRNSVQDLDKTIEEEMKEKISDEFQNKDSEGYLDVTK